MAAPVLQFKRGLLANLPGLRAGEPGFTTDSYDLYVGLTSETSTNKFFGSHRYWTKETTSTGSAVNLVEGTSNGSDYISIKSPDSLAGIVTYTFPATPVDGYFLKTNSTGGLSWEEVVSNLNIAGDTGTDTVSTGATVTFSGGTNINTVVSDDQVTINLNDDVIIGGGLTVTNNIKASSLNVEIATGDAEVLIKSNDAVGSDADAKLTLDAGSGGESEVIFNHQGTTYAQLSYRNDTNILEIAAANALDLQTGGSSSLLINSDGDANLYGSLEIGTGINDGTLTVGTGVGITQFTSAVGSGVSTTSVPTSSAIIDYVNVVAGNVDLEFGLDADTGGPSTVSTSQTLTISGTANEIETSVSGQTVTVGLPNNVVIGAGLTVTGALDVNGGGTIDNIQIGITGDNEIDTFSGNLTIDSAGGTTTIDDELIVTGDIQINGGDIRASDGNVNITITDGTLTTFASNIRVNGNNIQASDGNTNITMTSNTLTEIRGDLQVTGDDIKGSGGTTAITLSGANVLLAGDVTVGGNDIKASDGTTALTLSSSTGAVTAASDLTVTGNLYVSGNTTQVNTASLTVEDRTIDLGIVNGSVPAADTTWDLGVLFNYYTSGSAKKSAVIWEHADTRFKFASVLSADTNGSDNDTPQLSVTTFAPIEIGALWVNDCAGQSQVISCTGSERFLENITVDAGTF